MEGFFFLGGEGWRKEERKWRRRRGGKRAKVSLFLLACEKKKTDCGSGKTCAEGDGFPAKRGRGAKAVGAGEKKHARATKKENVAAAVRAPKVRGAKGVRGGGTWRGSIPC